MPAYLLVPKGVSATQKSAAILCLHGHGQFGKDSVVGIDDTPERAADIKRAQYDFGRRFAEQGYVVLAPDLRGFGERQPHYPDPKPDYCCRNYMAATLLGRTVVGYQLCDLHAALDVLQSLPYVDSEMLAAAGLSYGGRMTMVDQRHGPPHQGLRALRLPEYVPGTLPESKNSAARNSSPAYCSTATHRRFSRSSRRARWSSSGACRISSSRTSGPSAASPAFAKPTPHLVARTTSPCTNSTKATSSKAP